MAFTGVIGTLILAGCRHPAVPGVESDGPNSLSLSSSSLEDGRFPAALTCDGTNKSPALNWSAPPAGTRSFALILYDPDAPGGGFVHWVLFNLPPDARALVASAATQPDLPAGTRQGANDFGNVGYGGPCPSGTHHYVFTLLALDEMLDLPQRTTRATLDHAMLGHVLARGVLIASYSR